MKETLAGLASQLVNMNWNGHTKFWLTEKTRFYHESLHVVQLCADTAKYLRSDLMVYVVEETRKSFQSGFTAD